MTLKLKLNFDATSSIKKELDDLKAKAEKADNQNTHVKKVKRVPTEDEKKFFFILADLSKKFPNAFTLKGSRPSLKKGILADLIIELNLPKKEVNSFLSWYTSARLYLQNHNAGTPRVDLNGNITAYVTEDEAKGKISIFQNRPPKN
jgi:hypothetical protein